MSCGKVHSYTAQYLVHRLLRVLYSVFPGRHIHSNNITPQLLWEAFSHYAVNAYIIRSQISTTVCNQASGAGSLNGQSKALRFNSI